MAEILPSLPLMANVELGSLILLICSSGGTSVLPVLTASEFWWEAWRLPMSNGDPSGHTEAGMLTGWVRGEQDEAEDSGWVQEGGGFGNSVGLLPWPNPPSQVSGDLHQQFF